MHMMFVDESGDPGYPADGNWMAFSGSSHFARVGAIIHGDLWKTWHDKVMQFKRSEGLAWNAEIKASDIRSGKGAFMGWSRGQRDRFLTCFLGLAGATTDITLLGVLIDKRSVDTTKGDRLAKPQVRSLELLLERYNMFLDRQEDSSGIVILDPVSGDSDDNLRYFQSFLLDQSANLKPLHIVEGTFFVKSHTSNMMQVADVCTNVFYREMVRGGGTPDFSAIRSRFWHPHNRIHGFGIKRWP